MTNIVFKTETDDEVKFADVLELVFMQPLLMQYLVHPLLTAPEASRPIRGLRSRRNALSTNERHKFARDTPLARSVGYKKKDPHLFDNSK